MTTQPVPARAPMTAQGAQILRPNLAAPSFRTRLEPQILRNTPVQILRTTPAWPPPAAARPPAAAAPTPLPPGSTAPASVSALTTAPPPQGGARPTTPLAPTAAPAAVALTVPAAAPGAPAPAPQPTVPSALEGTANPASRVAANRASPADGGPPLGPEEFVPVPGEITFSQFLQGLNPLHHLPGVGTIYRAVTGAEIHPVMRVLGGAVFGGPVGMIMAAVGSAFEQTRPLERLGHTLAGRPDPEMPAPNSAAAQAAAAYARFGGA
jgi:hypothetical protein